MPDGGLLRTRFLWVAGLLIFWRSGRSRQKISVRLNRRARGLGSFRERKFWDWVLGFACESASFSLVV